MNKYILYINKVILNQRHVLMPCPVIMNFINKTGRKPKQERGAPNEGAPATVAARCDDSRCVQSGSNS